MTNYDTSKPYIQYIEDVLSGKQIEGWFVIKACERAKEWMSRDDIELRYEEIDRKIKLVQKIKQKKGLQAGKPFILLPFQQFIFMNIFGWYYVESEKRVIQNVLLMMARQTGKSYIAAAIALAIALDPTLPAPSVDYIANSAKQAAIAFGHCKDQCASLDPNGKIFKRFRQEIRVPHTGAAINVLSADDSKLDGRASYFISDEIHENRNWRLWEICKSGQGSLKNPLAIGISTAGWWVSEEYPLYSMWSKAKRVLSHTIEDDSWFYMIFQLDEEDNWQDPSVWHKAIPTLGIAVDEDFIKNRIQEAINTPTKEVEIKTKNLNMWCHSAQVWIPHDDIKEHQQHIELEDYEGEDVFMGIDFSMENDFSAFCVVIPPNKDRKLNPDKFLIKPFIYSPDVALEESPNRIMYKRWINSGHAFRTPGNVIDTLSILRDQLKIDGYMNIADIAYDQYYALDWQIHAEEEGLHVTKHNQSLGAFTPSTNFFENEFYKGTIILDDNPVFSWMFDNVEMMYNEKNKTKKPGKSDKHNKIDGIIAMLEAITAYNTDRGHIFGSVFAITDNKN